MTFPRIEVPVSRVIGFFALICSMAGIASAQTIDPGMTLSPTQQMTSAPGILLDSISTTTSSSGFGGDVLTFTARAAVYETTAGTLDFYYQVYNQPTSTDSMGRFTVSGFSGYSTNIFYQSGDSGGGGSAGFTAGSRIPISVDRDSTGSVLGFNYNPPPTGDGKLLAGETSYTMIIATDATSYKPGNFSVIDGVATTVQGFAPTKNTVPEPIALALLAPGLIGAVAFRRRRRD